MRFRGLVVSLIFTACSSETTLPAGPEIGVDEGAFTSAVATLLTFDFDAELISAAPPWNPTQAVQDYLLYTMGHLNADNAVGRLDKAIVTAFRSEALADGTSRVRFHVSLPVAWGAKAGFPSRYTFTLPKRGDWQGFDAFATKYAEHCVDGSAHEVSASNMWYYYRPRAFGCTLAPEDVSTFTATVVVSTENTTGKYPELHKVWEDERLFAIAIFGKYEAGATSTSDAGIAAFNRFRTSLKRVLGAGAVETVANPQDITFTQRLQDGRSITVTALLVDNILSAGADFDLRYNALSADADVIAYHGHAGLGSNVRALVRKGNFVAGKYQIFFMNGCDTFAYVDGALAQKKAELNPDDPAGTKYLDMLTNAMPAYFQSMSAAMVALLEGLRSVDRPQTYEQIFHAVDEAQVVVSTGEEDNVYYPGYPGDVPAPFTGYETDAEVSAKGQWRYETPLLPEGRYRFSLTGTGDADLYVRAGAEPTFKQWDCRPYSVTSNESCTLEVQAPTTVSVLVHGAKASRFHLQVASVVNPK